MPRHARDLGSLLAGLLFALIGLGALLGVESPGARWACPVLLLGLGTAGLLSSRE